MPYDDWPLERLPTDEIDGDVDVDEDGPFITASLDDPENWSTEKLDKWMDDYCEKHPDFNDALNGLF